MKATRTPIALTVLAAATLLVACERTTTVTQTSPGTTTTTTTVGPSMAASSAITATASATASAMDKAGHAAGDAIITGSVKTKLLADADVKALLIDVDTKDGVVTLSGSADNAGNVERAVSLAKGTEGVKSVENKLIVK